MNSTLVKPKNSLLKKYIQYFLFFKKTTSEFANYTTFPNNNLCLAIYKQNNILYSVKDQNKCIIQKSNDNSSIVSKLLGFHQTPFQVEISSELDQICIIFQPGALKVFTKACFEDLLNSDDVFNDIFRCEKSDLTRIFELTDCNRRVEELEKIIFRNYINTISTKMDNALFLIHNKDFFSVEQLSKELKISEVTLFREFKNNLGQNPKSYLKTIRFRNALNDILQSKHSLTNVAYQNQYFDQSHFIKDFKTFTGVCPKVISDKISVRQKQLLWFYNNK